jgi:hypothetical protein
VINLTERHRAHGSPAAKEITVGDEQEPLRSRMKLVTSREELDSTDVGQPLASYHYCDLVASIELRQRNLGGLSDDDAVVRREPTGEVALEGGENVAITLNAEQHWLAHAGYLASSCLGRFSPGQQALAWQ